jgi:hypothetical protein
VKSSEEIREILEAFDLTRSYRAAAQLAGCDHHMVRRYVRKATRRPTSVSLLIGVPEYCHGTMKYTRTCSWRSRVRCSFCRFPLALCCGPPPEPERGDLKGRALCQTAQLQL